MSETLSRAMRQPLTGDFKDNAKEYLSRYMNKINNPPVGLKICGRSIEIYPEDKLITIGGMPGTGKTALLSAETALDLIEQGVHVVICNYEMVHEGSIDRMVSCLSHRTIPTDSKKDEQPYINLTELRQGKAEYGHMQIYINHIFSRKGSINFIKPASAGELRSYLQKLSDKYPGEPIVIIYDYLQRMSFDDSTDMRIAVRNTLRSIQDIADEFEAGRRIHSIIVASVNRTAYGEASLSAYKEAGEIESDADIAIVLTLGEKCGDGWITINKDKLPEVRRQTEVDVLVNVLKSRNGNESVSALKFIKKRQAFENYAEAPRPKKAISSIPTTQSEASSDVASSVAPDNYKGAADGYVLKECPF